MSPGEFVPVAEESGLINRVDFVVMQTAIDAVRGINALLDTGIGLSANVSPRIFSSQNQQMQRWMDTVKAAGREFRLHGGNHRAAAVRRSRRGAQGAQRAGRQRHRHLDRRFRHRQRLVDTPDAVPVGIIKIDRSFTRAIGVGRAEEALIETILVMAERLDLRVVAEGVETREQYDYLRARRCEFVQGYFLGRPVSAAEFLEMARDAGTPRGSD